MSLEDRNWTAFMLDAEHDHHGYRRMVSVHNALRARIAELEARLSAAERVIEAAFKALEMPYCDGRHLDDGCRAECGTCRAILDAGRLLLDLKEMRDARRRQRGPAADA